MFGGLLEGDDGKSWWGNAHEFLNNAGNGASGGASIGANALYLGVPDALGITQTSALTGKEFETAHRISPAISTASSVIVGAAAIKLATTASGAVTSAIKGADTGANAVKTLETSAPKAALTTELQANTPATVSAAGRAAENRITTVLGSLDDVAKFKGKSGYNVLNVPDSVYKKMTTAEFDRLNAEWLNAALRRGDRIMAVTDPAAHAQFLERIRPGLSSQSRYLNLELPMLEEFGVFAPNQTPYSPTTPFIVNP